MLGLFVVIGKRVIVGRAHEERACRNVNKDKAEGLEGLKGGGGSGRNHSGKEGKCLERKRTRVDYHTEGGYARSGPVPVVTKGTAYVFGVTVPRRTSQGFAPESHWREQNEERYIIEKPEELHADQRCCKKWGWAGND